MMRSWSLFVTVFSNLEMALTSSLFYLLIYIRLFSTKGIVFYPSIPSILSATCNVMMFEGPILSAYPHYLRR